MGQTDFLNKKQKPCDIKQNGIFFSSPFVVFFYWVRPQ